MANTFANILGGIDEQNEALKKKSNPKQFDGVENDKPFVKTRKKTNKTK